MTKELLWHRVAIARQMGRPSPVEYVVLFLVVVAGVLTLVR
jgi:hypothetical protein